MQPNSQIPLVEPVAVPDVFFSGAAAGEDLGDGTFRLNLYVRQTSLTDGTVEHIVVMKLVGLGAAVRSLACSALHLTGAQSDLVPAPHTRKVCN